MKKMRTTLLVAGLVALLGNPGMAQENEKTEKKDSVTRVTKTIRVENAEDLQKALGSIFGGSVTVAKDSASATKPAVKKEGEKVPRQEWWAKSIINQKAPELAIHHWVGNEPELEGKFLFVYFWSTTCGPCIKKIPTLNEWNKMFQDEMVMIGMAPDDSVERMEKTGKPKIEFYRAVEDGSKTTRALERHVNSYVLMIDPEGIVRLEDVANNITPEIIRGVLDKYGKKK